MCQTNKHQKQRSTKEEFFGLTPVRGYGVTSEKTKEESNIHWVLIICQSLF